MEEAKELQPVLTALEDAEALRLARRAAAARGLSWPDEPGAVRGAAGFAANLTHHPGRERVAWATLPGQRGVLGLFAGDKLVATADRALGQITAVQPVALPGVEHLALMVDDQYDNLTGGFLREARRRIYSWDGRGLRQLFVGILEAEQFRHARWENASAPQVWKRQRTTGEVELTGGELTYNLKEEWLEAVGRVDAPIPPPEKFRVVREKATLERLRWNPRLRRFEPV